MLNVRYASIYHKIFTCLLSRLNKTNCVVLKAYFNDLRLLNFPIGLSVWNDVTFVENYYYFSKSNTF